MAEMIKPYVVTPYEYEGPDVDYSSFNPYVPQGDYVTVYIEDNHEKVLKEAGELCMEQIKCLIPMDFKDHIVVSFKEPGPANDPLAQKGYCMWNYTPPVGAEMNRILADAKYRDSKPSQIKFRRYSEFKAI